MIPKYDYNGESYTLTELSKKTGILKPTLYRRIVICGMPIDDAVNGKGIITYKGQQMTIKQLSDLAGVQYRTLWHRIRRRGMTPEQAIAEPIGNRIYKRQKCTCDDCFNCPYPDCIK